MINDMGIQVLESAPDADDLMLNENVTDEDAVEEATQVLSMWNLKLVEPPTRCVCICVKWEA